MTDLRARLEAALGSTYRLEQELGGGGMSRVFRAEELALGRQVVIKVLPPEMGAGVNEDRFRREVQLAARLQHPHIVPLLAAGSADGLLWYAMPFVEGESLRARLVRGGELPVDEAVRILREVTDALAYAHDKGVVHRDIKPDNVMLSGSHALVTDFGVAKAVSDSAAGSGALTSLGLALGTPAYMAPEQASADPNVDQRADLYALGAMAFEMLTGRPPFTAPTPQAVLAAHLIQTPERVSALRPAVPPPLEALVQRCLEKRPADRWQRAADLLPQLESLLTPSGATAPFAPQVVSSGTEHALRKTHPVRVAVLFAIGALAVLSLTWWVVQRLGLPDWVVIAAGVLLLAGLPIVLVAARHEQRRLLAGKTDGAAAPAGVLGRLTTLRGALAGGGLAFGGLMVGTAAFMLLRMAGVGPFATLLSAGVLKDRGLLVVADFQTSAEDSVVAASITEALKIDLGQSPAVRLLEGRQVAQALERMQKPVDSRIDVALAQDIAQREGAAAVVAGEVSRLGDGYVLSARLVSASDGSTLLGVRESAPDQAGLIAAVDRISRKLREGIGESLRSIRSGEPLEQVTTTSLEALRLYTQGEHARDAGRLEESVRLWEQAIAADSNFAMAWRKLSVALFNTGGDAERQFAAAQRAYDLRARLPRREADLAMAYYFQTSGNRPQAIEAYQRMLATWPDDIPARNNLALLLNVEGRYPEAERILRVAIDSGAVTAALFDNLIDSYMWRGQYPEAESTAVRYGRAVPAAVGQSLYFRSAVAFSEGRFDEYRRLADSMGQLDDATWRGYSSFASRRARVLGGQLRDALALQNSSDDLAAGGAARNGDRLGREAGIALAEGALLGRVEAAGQRLAAAMARYPLDSVPPRNRQYPNLIMTAAMLDRPDLVARLEMGFQSVPRIGQWTKGDEAWVRASVAAANHQWPQVVVEARMAQKGWGCPVCLLPMIGLAFDQLQQPDSALAAYEAYATRLAYMDFGQEIDLPRVLVRLGELYESRGDNAQALEYYGKFVDLWKDADPELQPRVADIRKRIGQLAGEPGPR